MAFNAGGTNVGGVQSIEQGNLKVGQNLVAVPTAPSDNYSSFTVPAGKKWILKHFNWNSGSLTATVSQLRADIRFSAGPANDIGLYLSATTTSKGNYDLPHQLVLSAGDILKVGTTLSAYTSGTITHNVIYMELDA